MRSADHVVRVAGRQHRRHRRHARRSGAHPYAIRSTWARRPFRPRPSNARKAAGRLVFATFDGDGQHRVKDVRNGRPARRAGDVDVRIGTCGSAGLWQKPASRPMKRIVLQTGARLTVEAADLAWTDTNNGLRVFNKTVADGQHHHERHEPRHRVHHVGSSKPLAGNEEPVEVLYYTEYSKSKGQPPLKWRQHHFRRVSRGRMPR